MVRKGQASLEYLLVSVVAISLLLVSASALYGIREMAMYGISAAAFRSGAATLADAGNEVCALGDGNGREIALGEVVSVESEKADEGWVVRFSGPGNESMVRPCRCEAEEAQGLFGLVYVENKEGRVVIRER